MKDNQIYLGKLGKIFGPYTREEYDQMDAAGQLIQYNWIWDAKGKVWKPMDLPPPSPEGQSLSSGPDLDWSSLEGLLFDRFSIVSGKIRNVTESGCAFFTDGHSGSPTFALKSSAGVNLFSKGKKKCVQTQISIIGASFEDNQWIYRLRWDEVPKF